MAKGIVFTPQASNPLGSGKRGLWINSTNDLIFETTSSTVNVTQNIEDLQSGIGFEGISKLYLNNTGLTIAAGTPVYTPTAGEIAPAKGDTIEHARIVGVTTEEIIHGNTGKVMIYGIVSGISGFPNGEYLYLTQTAGEMTDVEPTNEAYPSGFVVFIVGLVEGTNLILQPTFVGKL